MAGLPHFARGFCGRLVRGSASCSDDARTAERIHDGMRSQGLVAKNVCAKVRKSDQMREIQQKSNSKGAF